MTGTSRTVTVRGNIGDARRRQRELQAAGRPSAPEPEPANDVPTCLTDLAADFLRTREPVLSPRTLRIYRDDYRLRIAPRIGHLPLDQISRHICERFVADLAATAASHRMLRGTVTTLRAILAKGVEWHPSLLPVNPAARLTLPPHDDSEDGDARRILTEQQLRHLLDHGSPKLRVKTMLRAAAEGGLRRGEICGLRWPDVDLKARRLRVRRSYDGPTKGRRARTISISPGFVAALDAWYAESVIRDGADASGPVWPGARGSPMNEHTPTQTCARALARAGLVDEEGRPLVTLHGLRHTCASLMLMKGVPLIVVSRHLGHADVNITARVYAHLTDDSQMDAAADAFQNLLGGADTLGDTLGDRSRTT
jgi:integrase